MGGLNEFLNLGGVAAAEPEQEAHETRGRRWGRAGACGEGSRSGTWVTGGWVERHEGRGEARGGGHEGHEVDGGGKRGVTQRTTF